MMSKSSGSIPPLVSVLIGTLDIPKSPQKHSGKTELVYYCINDGVILLLPSNIITTSNIK